jgi:hypothetical protein
MPQHLEWKSGDGEDEACKTADQTFSRPSWRSWPITSVIELQRRFATKPEFPSGGRAM